MSFVDDVAAAWAREDAEADTDAAWRGVRQGKRAAQVAEAVADASEDQMSDEEALEMATLIVTWSDAGAKRFGGEVYAQSPEETERLIAVTAPVVQRHIPRSWTLGSVPPEWLLLGTVAMIYWPKFLAARRAKAEAERAGGKDQEKEVHGSVTARRQVHAVS